MDMLIKSQLLSKLSKSFSRLTEKDVMLAVQHLMSHVASVLSHGGRVEIRGFGSFTLHYRPARLAHNPKTGEKLVTDPKYAVYFKPGKAMREQVHANRHIPITIVHHDDQEDQDIT